MKAPVTCPRCHSTFSFSRSHAGKRAKCPKCKEPFEISFDSPNSTLAAATQVAAENPPPIPGALTRSIAQPAETQPKMSVPLGSESHPQHPTKRLISLPQWAIIAVPAVVTLLLGYFIGREHLKYQMRSAFAGMAEAFSHETESSPKPPLPVAVEPEPNPLPQLMIGKTHQAEGFAVTLVNAKIAATRVKDVMGKIGIGKSPDLALSLVFANTDERRILRFHEGNQFLGGNLQLRDDVGNVIRGINYGFASKPVGALSGSEDIDPGTTASHLELFAVPPSKTQYLILTIDLACFGGDGKIEYKIPASSIVR